MKKVKLSGIPDDCQVLDYKHILDTAKALKILDKGDLFSEEIGKLDMTDLVNLEKWYFSFKALYTYGTPEKNLSDKQKHKFEDIEKSKGDLDVMNLIEISVGRLLEKSFTDNSDNVRVRKTNTFDDVNSGMDYIIEFLDDNNKVSEIIGIDLTISDNESILFKKKLRKNSTPDDYLKHIKKREGKSFKSIPRLVLKLDKNLVYSFTNNFFTSIIEKGDTLSNSELSENFDYAIEDLKIKNLSADIKTFDLKIQEIIDLSKQKAKNIL